MFKKKFDHNDLYHYLPDNNTIATTRFYERKFNGMLDVTRCRFLEAKSRKEFNDNDILEIINDYKKDQNKIIDAYNEIVEMSKHDKIELEEKKDELELKSDVKLKEENE
jgi:hypothetical protein